MPSLCIIADTHRRHRELTIPKCDILIHCGDMCSFQNNDMGTLDDIDDWFAQVPARHVVAVGGNHDFPLGSREFQFRNAQLLEDRQIEVEGLSIYGAPWCPELSGFAYYLSDADLAERWKRIPTGIDILITHTPPFGILDLSTRKDVHLGCRFLRGELKRIRPRLHVFGHIHASHGTMEEDGSLFVNAAVVGGRDFEIRHAGITHTITAGPRFTREAP